MRTDADRLNWLIENSCYSLLDSDYYGKDWYEKDRFEMVRREIDAAMDGDEEEKAANQ